jgi:hypothetical protein
VKLGSDKDNEDDNSMVEAASGTFNSKQSVSSPSARAKADELMKSRSLERRLTKNSSLTREGPTKAVS